jgi:hypothetical protein
MSPLPVKTGGTQRGQQDQLVCWQKLEFTDESTPAKPTVRP